MKTKCKLAQCSCGKTISKHNGDLDNKICFICKENESKREEKFRLIREGQSNRAKKRPKKTEKDMEKLAKVVS